MVWPLLAFTCLMVGAFLSHSQDPIAAHEPMFPPAVVAVEIQFNGDTTAVPTPTATPTPYTGLTGRN